MNLEERIARLIDPEAWWLLDQHLEEHPDPDERPPSRFTIESRDAARRVIDELHLKKNEFMTFNGPVKGIIKGHIDQEDQ